MKPKELARWAWRQLTSMRTALILLFLLALGAVPGSVIPQQTVDSFRYVRWREEHPRLTPIYDRLELFSVYNSVWFSAIYILLMISLVGCIVPRLRVYWRGLRAQPPKAPKNLSRLPEHRVVSTSSTNEDGSTYEDGSTNEDSALETAAAWLRRRRYRVVVSTSSTTGEGTVAAERGYLREAGNLLFHLSVLIVLVGFALGSLWGFTGGAIVVTRDGFANTLSQYDDFRSGLFFDADELAPFEFTVNDFAINFLREGRQAGMAQKFAADLSYSAGPGEAVRRQTIEVNKPLKVDDTNVFLIGHGYAPHITVRNADGTIAYSGPTVFLPQNNTFLSFGVVKVPDARQRGSSTQIGFEGEFYPTYGFTKASGPFSAFPDAKNPAISMLAYRGDLGMDSGQPQSVYALDKKKMKPIRTADGKPLRIDVAQGRSVRLPDGLGTLTFDGMSRFVKVQISSTPGQTVTLSGTILALVGLLGSLFIRPRRIWIRTRVEGGRTLVEVAGLDRSAGGDPSAEIDSLTESLRAGAVAAPSKESP